MHRYTRYSDYYPTPLKYQYRYFYPSPVLPITYGAKYTCHCGPTTNNEYGCAAWEKISAFGGTLEDQKTYVRDHSLKKILPWRVRPGTDVLKDVSMYSGRNVNFNGNNSTTPIIEKFPDLVKETNICAAHANKSHTWAGSKVLPYEWRISNQQLYSGADCIHNKTSIINSLAKDCIEETRKNQVRSLTDTNHDIKQRLNDIETWISNMKNELRYNIDQTHEMMELKDRLEIMIRNIQNPLELAQENLYTRESRQGNELVHDQVENTILLEIEILRNSEEKLLQDLDKLNVQLTQIRASRHELELDIRNKEMARNTDESVEMLNSSSYEIGPIGYIGIENAKTSPLSWLQNTQALIQRSQDERHNSKNLFMEICRSMQKVANDSFANWNETNRSFGHRISEIIEAKQKLEEKIKKIDYDIEHLRRHIKQVQLAAKEKKPALDLAETRVDKRKQRPGLELCRDRVSISLINEMHSLKLANDKLNYQLEEMEETMGELLKTKSCLENDLKLKNIALFIDRDKCLNLRQKYPISTFKECLIPNNYSCAGNTDRIFTAGPLKIR